MNVDNVNNVKYVDNIDVINTNKCREFPSIYTLTLLK